MQQQAQTRIQTHDLDVLQAVNVKNFKAWLLANNYTVHEPSGEQAARGVLFWVALSKNKKVCVREGRGANARYVETHQMLRSILNKYLSKPLVAAIKSTVAVRQAQPDVTRTLTMKPARAANNEPADPSPAVESAQYLLNAAEITAAMHAPRMAPEDIAFHVIGVFVPDAATGGRCVVSLMAVSKGLPCERRVEVLRFPFLDKTLLGGSSDIKVLAATIVLEASTLKNCTVMVDLAGRGAELFQRLTPAANGYNRFGLTLGSAPGGEYNKRFINQRTQCAVHAAEAIRRGRMKLAGDMASTDAYGTRIPYQFDEQGRYRISSKNIVRESETVPDLFLASCLAFVPIDFAAPPPAVQRPAEPKPAPALAAPKQLATKDAEYLEDLRDDFALNCPLAQKEGESLADYAQRRWDYAEVMINTRPTNVRG